MSADQEEMEFDGMWPPTSTKYKDSQDYNDCKFLGYEFQRVILRR